MDETTVIIIIAVLVFFMMNNKKSCNCREKFSAQCPHCDKLDIRDRQCCEAKCKLTGKDDSSKLMIQRRCDGITKSLSDFGVSGSSSGTSGTSSTSSTSNSNIKSVNVIKSLEEICRNSNLI